MKSQKTVTAYFKSQQLLSVGFLLYGDARHRLRVNYFALCCGCHVSRDNINHVSHGRSGYPHQVLTRRVVILLMGSIEYICIALN